ncbi:LysR family transcriptional regulator [Yoonia sp. BS5-3]|uniref:LysR family transcriptional regulator n=1 Tax=Yoonia phaeophyticola TaxID=3137369 RepID=A0ABZ2VBE2_9RHOB
MRLEWIEDILAVSEMGSFNTAAEARFLTPSAFTRRIRMIEETLGCELFDRTKKPIVLKRHVRDILPTLRAAAADLRRVRQLLAEPEVDLNQRITLICQHALTASVAPQLLMHSTLGQNASARIKSGRRSECLLAILKQKAEFALIYEIVGEDPEIDTEYSERLVLGREKFMPVIKTGLAPEFEDAAAPEPANGSLPMVAYPSSIFLGEVLQRLLANRSNQSVQLIRVAETGLSLALIEFVRQGLGVGWLPNLIAKSDLTSGAFTPMDHLLPGFELNVVVARMKRDLPPKAEEFWEAMKNDPELELG